MLIFLAVLIVVVAFSLTMMPIHGQICEKPNAGHEECTAYNIIPFLFVVILHALNDWGTAVTALFTFVLAISTIGLWLQTARLARGADDQSQKMVSAISATLEIANKTTTVADAMAEAASAMRRVASQTERLANHNIITAEQELPAYLAVDTVSPDPNIKGEYRIGGNSLISAVLFLKNTGQTPAYMVEDWVMIVIDDWPIPRSLPPPTPADIEGRGRSIINPGQAISITGRTTWQILPKQIVDIQKGDSAVYIYGRIDFVDAFGKPRWVTYRLAGRSVAESVRDLQVCQDGNDAN